jgi:hypothetical protein
MMDLEFGEPIERGLRHYVNLVARELGLSNHGTSVSLDPPMNAYLALDRRLASHPERDVALLWDELHGWSVAVETHGGADLLVLAYIGSEVVPAPADVAGLVHRMFAGEPVGSSLVPAARPSGDLTMLLTGYVDLGAPLRL